MTLLASWAAIDTHGISSAYIVSDSRISWENKKYFDFGKKVFASKKYPEIFGYAGDVLFPSIVLSQIIDMIDTDVLFDESMTCSKKNKIVFEKLQYSFSKYPDVYGDNPIQIIHISRDTMVDKYPNFHHYLLTWDRKYGGSKEEKVFPIKSGILNVLGSGKEEFEKNYNERYQSCINKSTSRNVFHCFIDTLYNIQDTMCGGSPQLVGYTENQIRPHRILELYIIRKDFYWEWKFLRNLYIIKLNGVMKILNYAMEHKEKITKCF